MLKLIDELILLVTHLLKYYDGPIVI